MPAKEFTSHHSCLIASCLHSPPCHRSVKRTKTLHQSQSIQATDTVEFERCRQEKHVGRESRRKGLAFEAKQDEWYATPQTSGYGCRSRFVLGRIRTFAIGTKTRVWLSRRSPPHGR